MEGRGPRVNDSRGGRCLDAEIGRCLGVHSVSGSGKRCLYHSELILSLSKVDIKH